jgi:hypothetical protein
MLRMLVVTGLVLGALGCGGGLSKQEAARQLDQMVVLYSENRIKFVAQKQELEKDCGRASALRQAAADRTQQEAMSPQKNEALTLVSMELQQAEQTCKSR